MVGSLVLTVTRRCNLRCSYCPTVKDGFPSLTTEQALSALSLFEHIFGSGEVKLFGGEPLLEPETVRAVLAAAEQRPALKRVYLSTNGLGLDDAWLDSVAANPKCILTLSLDGRPEDHRRLRRALPQVADSYDHVMQLLPRLTQAPRVVVTQTIAPATASNAADNFAHLLGLGFRRFNFLPGYYLAWRPEQLRQLRESFARMAAEITERWRHDEYVYVRNLFTWAPTPFFNSGMIVDSDGSIHPSNLGLSGALADLLPETRVGSLDSPPTRADLEAHAATVNQRLQTALVPAVWQSTLDVDRALTRFCRGLFAEFVRYRRRRRAA